MAEGTRSSTGRASRLVLVLGLAACAFVAWLFAGPLSETDQTRRHFADLQRRIEGARATKNARAAERGRVARLRAQARAAAEPQRAALEAEAVAVERASAWGDRAIVRGIVLGAPLLPYDRSAAIPGFAEASTERENGCLGCHVSIAEPDYTQYPNPFRSHSRLASFVGAASPHPPSRVRCVSCHQGDGAATSFEGAGHARMTTGTAAAQRRWADVSAAGAMLPVGRVEAGCAGCHEGEVFQPGAPALNEALLTLDRGGCYACHTVPGLDRSVRRGPDLRRIRGKLSADWVAQWLANPRAVKPATWMPAFWPDADAQSAQDRIEIDAVVAFLFAGSEDYTPAAASPPRGDAERGKAVVERVGCLGCHVTGAVERDAVSVRRTFGQPLQAIGGKASYAWLYDWVRDPARYSPGTRMPNLRLTDAEAADVATWLASLDGPATPPPAAAPADDAAYRTVIDKYREQAGDAAVFPPGLSGDRLRVAAGRTVVAALGCYSCHEIAGFAERRIDVPLPTRLVWADGDIATHARPAYRFGRSEQARLGLALTTVAGRVRDTHAMSMPWHVAKVTGRAIVQRRNCMGCHQLESAGGDFLALVAEPTLGPPLLTPEGSRVQPDWLDRFLRQPQTIRPWLAVRMPTFGLSNDERASVSGYLRAIAPDNPRPAAPPSGATAGAGRELFTLLKCQQCHVLGAIPTDQPTSNLAPDLRMAHERLQPDWILAWLRNPAAILPGTRMPSFWPDYPKSFYPPLGQDGAAQVYAIREHVRTLR